VTLTPAVPYDILGMDDTNPMVLTGLNIHPPYQAIRHTLCGPLSMVRWTKYSLKRFHKSLPYAHMVREAQVWLKIVMHILIPRLHYTNITSDRACLVYALMTTTELNIGAILKSAMRKACVHKVCKYAFGDLITHLCCSAGVPEEFLYYMAPLFAV